MTTSFCIKNATVINDDGMVPADVLVEDRCIAEILPRPHSRTLPDSVVDADGLWLLPGGIDAHTHFGMPLGGDLRSRSWRDSSEAAIHGGTTTIVDFANPEPGQSLHDAVARWRQAADKESLCDYGLHVTVPDTSAERLREIPDLVAGGLPTFKAFLAYKDRLMLSPEQLADLMRTVHGSGGTVWLHAEDGELNAALTARLIADGKTAPQYHPQAHPAASEISAIETGIRLAEATGCPLTVVHLSTAGGLSKIIDARKFGTDVRAEICIQHLFRNDDWYRGDTAQVLTAIMSPPLRPVSDSTFLCKHLNNPGIVQISTDHCEFALSDKTAGKDFAGVPNGGSGVGERLIVLHTLGVATGLITPQRWVELCATGPARNCGLAHRKGRIAAGLDADLVLFDPRADDVSLPFNAENSLWVGVNWRGRVLKVWLQGNPVLTKGKISLDRNFGAFIKRDHA
jgi:dihydropyrimidinase